MNDIHIKKDRLNLGKAKAESRPLSTARKISTKRKRNRNRIFVCTVMSRYASLNVTSA